MFLLNICLFLLSLNCNYINSEYYNEYECNTPLLTKAVLSATSSMKGRGPQNAILYGSVVEKTFVRWYFNFTKWTPSAEDLKVATTRIQVEEKQRLSKFVFKKDFKSSLIGRLMMRKFVALHSDKKYNEIGFSRDPKGKPYLLDEDLANRLRFNVSHQGDLVAFAGEITQTSLLGVDVMKLEYTGGKDLDEFFRIMRKTFSTYEWDFVNSFSSDVQRVSAFCRLWCLKESYVKATGIGIILKLETISFKINTKELTSDTVTIDTELFVNGVKQREWFFEEMLLLDKSHAVAVARTEKVKQSVVFKEITFDELVEDSEGLLDIDEQYVSDYFEKLDKNN